MAARLSHPMVRARLFLSGNRLGVDVPPPPEGQAVDLPARKYMASIASDVRATIARTSEAFLKYKRVREQLGLPVIGGTGISQADFERGDRLAQQGRILLTALDDAAAGRRRVAIHDGDWWIEGLATDTGRLIVTGAAEGAVASIVEANASVSGPRALGEPVSVGAAAVIIAATAIAALAAYFAWKAAMDALKRVIEQKTAESIAKRAFDCVESGTCSPEQAQAIATGTLTAAAQLAAAGPSAEAKESEAGFSGTVRTIAWVALGIGVIYLIAQVVPAFAASSSSRRMLPA